MNPLIFRRRMMVGQGGTPPGPPVPVVNPIFHATYDNDFSDSAPNPLTVTANSFASIDTEVKKTGTGSLLVRYSVGTHDRGGVAYSYGKDMNFSQHSFTVEAWLRILSVTDNIYHGICGIRPSASRGGSWSCGIHNGKLNISFSTSGASFSKDIESVQAIPNDTWVLVKFQRDYENGKVYGFINGTKVIDETMTGAIYAGTDNGFAVGNYHTDQVNDGFYGYIDDLKVFDQIV